jgi:hypothetical protein
MDNDERLRALFRGLTRGYGTYELAPASKSKAKVKKEGKALTVRGEVNAELWEKHFQGTVGLGIVPLDDQGVSYFGAIDVDVYPLDIAALEKLCRDLHLPLLPTRTKSGGAHLYLFVKGGARAELVRTKLDEWAGALGHGGCEIFPKQNALHSSEDVGNWINMPYFGYKSGTTERYGILAGEPLFIEEYCTQAEKRSVTEEQLENITAYDPTMVVDEDAFKDGPPCLQCLGRTGFGEGMRNNGLFGIGVYLKKRYPDDWKAHLLAYNARFMKPPLTELEVKTTVKALQRKEYSYTCTKAPLKQFCSKQICTTREFGIGAGQNWDLVVDKEIQKVLTDPPHYYMTVNGIRIRLTAEEMLSQTYFQRKCMQLIDYVPPTIPSAKWREMINVWLKDAVKIEAPDDASLKGELKGHLEFFCASHEAETRNEILVGRVFADEGWWYFKASYFKEYLSQRRFSGFAPSELFATLRDLGMEPHQLWIDDRNVATWRWKVDESQKSAAHVPAHSVSEEGSM